MSKSTIRPMPSPNGTNHSRQFLRMSVVSADELAHDFKPKTSGLVKALREKYSCAEDAMHALDLPASLLRDENPSQHEEEASSMRHGRFDPCGPGGAGEIEAGRERRGEDRRRARGRDHIPAPEERHVSPLQNEGEDDERLSDEEEQSFSDFAEDLHAEGWDEGDIKRIIGTARDSLRRARGRDRLPERVDVRDDGKDKLPARAGHFSRPRFGRDNEVDDPTRGVAPPQGIDRGRGSFEERWPEIARIEHEPEPRDLSRDSRRRHAMDSKTVAMTEARKQKLYQRYPGLERLDA